MVTLLPRKSLELRSYKGGSLLSQAGDQLLIDVAALVHVYMQYLLDPKM